MRLKMAPRKRRARAIQLRISGSGLRIAPFQVSAFTDSAIMTTIRNCLPLSRLLLCCAIFIFLLFKGFSPAAFGGK
jgi:hypothetical protein